MITQKPNSCSGCPLNDKGLGFVPDKISKNTTDYVMFGEAPGKQEVAASEPFIGKAGYVLKHWLIRAVPLIQLAVEKGRVTYSNVLRCLPPDVRGRAYPTGLEREQAEACCKQYLAPTDAHTIILFGEHPQRFFFGPELEAEDASDRRIGREVKGVLGRIGRVYERDEKRWVFAPHPAFVLRQPALVEHGQQALKIAAGQEKVVAPDYIPWDTAIQELS